MLVHLNAADAEQLARIRAARRRGDDQPDLLSLALGRRRGRRRLGGAAEQLLPHRSLARQRIPFGIATDNKPADPWLAFAAVVARRDMRTGDVRRRGERLTRAQALPR